MTTVSTAELLGRAHAAGTGIAAFNVITLEHAEGLVLAAERTGVPVIVQISQNAVRYHGALEPLAAAVRALADVSSAELSLHLDHVEDRDALGLAPAAGFSSAMFDAGNLGYDENVAKTASATAWAHANGLQLEAELGYVGGKAGAPASAHAPGVRTDPAEAAAYVAATGVDALAVAVGSSHAMTARTATLDIDLITRLREAVPVPLVLHGSSGVPDGGIRDGIRAGLTKINVGTALNVGFTAAIRQRLGTQADLTDPRIYLSDARAAVADVASRMIEAISG